ncbi:MAG: MarR family transcriptional regulator [Chthonomonadales bacterium]
MAKSCVIEHPERSTEAITPEAMLEQQLHRMLGALVFRHDPGGPFTEMPINQIKCLHIVAEHEGLKMVDAANMMEIKLPSLSQIVEKLVHKNLIERQPDLSDRRVVRLGLTPSSRELIASSKRKRSEIILATCLNLSSEEMQVITSALSSLAGAAEKTFSEANSQSVSYPDEPDKLMEWINRKNLSRAPSQ